MKLAIVTVADGNFVIRSEHDDKNSALIAYDNLHAALVGDSTMKVGVIKILDEQLDCFEGRMDIIKHEELEPEPEPEA